MAATARNGADDSDAPGGSDSRFDVVLVDQNDRFRTAASTLLAREGIGVTGVGDTAAAAAVVDQSDCVVVDPGVGGEVEVHRAAWLGLEVPVVVATGAPAWALPETTWTVADAYVEKGRAGTFATVAATVREVCLAATR